MEVKGQITINDLMVKIMKAKGIKGNQLAETMGVSTSHVSQVTGNSKNHWISTVKDFFSGMNESFTILKSDFMPFEVPGTIVTMNQLRKKLKTFYFRFENGHVYEIIPYEVWNEPIEATQDND